MLPQFYRLDQRQKVSSLKYSLMISMFLRFFQTKNYAVIVDTYVDFLAAIKMLNSNVVKLKWLYDCIQSPNKLPLNLIYMGSRISGHRV